MRSRTVAFVWTLLTLQEVTIVRSKNIPSFAGPYIAFGHTFEVCPSAEAAVLKIRPSHFNPQKPHELQRITGYWAGKEDIADSFLSSVDLAIRSNNQWKENAFIFNFPGLGCTAIRTHVPDLFRLISKISGAPMDPKTPCVIPKGHWEFKNESVDWTFPHFPIIPYGHYRFRVRVKRPANSPQEPRFGGVVACIEVDCEVIPKPGTAPRRGLP